MPVDRFDEAINLLAETDEKILERKIGSEDVTGEAGRYSFANGSKKASAGTGS